MAGFLGLSLALALGALLQFGGETPTLDQLVPEQALGRLVGPLLALQPGAGVLGGGALALHLCARSLQFLLQGLGPFQRLLGALQMAVELGLAGQGQGPPPDRDRT